MTPIKDKNKRNLAIALNDYLDQPETLNNIPGALRNNLRTIQKTFYKNEVLTEEGFKALLDYCTKHFIKLPEEFDVEEEHDASKGNPFNEKEQGGINPDWTKEEINTLTQLIPTAKSIKELQESIPTKTLPQIRRKIYNLKLHKQFRGSGIDFNDKQSKNKQVTAETLKQNGIDVDLMPNLTQNLIISYTAHLQELTGKKVSFQ